jgi:hypothetical protein
MNPVAGNVTLYLMYDFYNIIFKNKYKLRIALGLATAPPSPSELFWVRTWKTVLKENNKRRNKNVRWKKKKWRENGGKKHEQELIKMRHFSVLRNLIPYTHLFSARERHIFAAGALLVQMAAITRQSMSLYSYELFDTL